MATEVTPPLSGQALKYGRNVMAVAGAILVLAWVPDIDIDRFKPLGFDFKKGGEIALWGLLGAALAYYSGRFLIDVYIDYSNWRREYRTELLKLKGALKAADKGSSREREAFNKEPRSARYRALRNFRRRFYIDVAIPSAMSAAAVWAVASRMFALWPTA